MCWACEEEAMFRRYLMERAVEEGVMPPGYEPEDFEMAGLPVPPRRAPTVDRLPSLDQASAPSRAVENPESLAPRSGVGGDERRERDTPVNPFVCDAPDGK